MVTKDGLLLPENDFLNICGGKSETKYNNLNLKQKHQNFSNAFSKSSKNISISNEKHLDYDFASYDAKNESHSWNKATKNLSPNFRKIGYRNEENKWKKDKNHQSLIKSDSTLWLHIEAYEKMDSSDFVNGIKEENLKQKRKNVKQIFADSASFVFQNPFEFSRQQENDQFKKPEIAQFRTSQQLINPNQMHQNFGGLMNQGNFQQQFLQKSGGSSEFSRKKMTDIDGLIQSINTAILDYCANPSSPQLSYNLEEQLTVLVRESALIDNSGRLKPHVSHVEQLLYQTYELLSASSTPITIRSKLLLYLYNLSQYNVKIRRYLSGDLQIAGIVYQNLKIALQQHLGPQNLIDNLRLLQVLTYEKSLVLADWTTELLQFLLNEITRANDQEWLPYCVAILCNLVCRSKAVCSKIMKDSKIHKALCKKLLEFLQNSSRTIVICSLTMVGYLHEQTRDIVFSPPHLSETFLCIFNIMKSRENIMTRHVAVDLCRRLIISESSNTSLGPSLANTAKDLTTFSFFKQCVRDLACHLVLLDARTEECIKLYEFFIAICQLHQLRSHVCSAILSTKPIENRLTTPILGMLSTAAWTFDESIDPEAPILACELLTFVLKEAVDSNQPIQHFVPLESLVDLIRINVKTTIETKSEIVSYQCRRITCGLRLADAISGDEEARKELLDTVSAQLCAHVNESQLLSNPISLYLSKPPSQRSPTDLPEWSTYGVTIPLELLKLLASLKDYNKAHKELYWRSLKDERLIPFLAYSISYGNSSTVYDALTIFTHCTQVQDYRIKLLSDLIASCGKTKTTKDRKSPTENGATKRKSVSMDTSAEFFKDNILLSTNGSPANSQKDIDELLTRMKNNMDIRDVRFSQLVQVFESKIGMLQEREAYLEREITDLRKLHAKTRSQRGADPVENGAFRQVIVEMERKVDEAETEKLALQSEKEALAKEVTKLIMSQENMKALLDSSKAAIDELQKEKVILLNENDKERELHTSLREKFNEMRNNFDKATKAALEKQQENMELKNELMGARDEIRKLNERLRQEQVANDKLKEEKAELQRLKQQLAKMLS